ncbi:MAG: O-antigen ligase family protein [Mobilitalea sp.]
MSNKQNLYIRIAKLQSKRKNYLILIIIILIFSKNSFYLWLQDDYLIGSFFKYSDIGVYLSILFTLWIMFRFGFPYKNSLNRYIVFFAIMVLISALTAWFVFDQNLLRGILAQRVQLSYLILFLAVERLLELKKIEKTDIIRLVYMLAVFELSICTIQYFYYIISGKMFLVVSTGIRYGDIRFYFEPALLLIVTFRSFFNVLSNKKNRIINIIFVVWVCFFIMYITKMRAMSLLLIACFVIGLLIWNKKLVKKILICTLLFIFGLFLLGKIEILQDIFNTITGQEIIENTLDIRDNARGYYIKQVMKTPVTGRGYPSISSTAAFQASGFLQNYKFVDNGIFGFVYSYGLVGFIWYIGFWITLFKLAWKIRKKDSSYFIYMVYYLLGIITDFAWFWHGCCSFVLLISMLQYDYKELKKDKSREIK